MASNIPFLAAICSGAHISLFLLLGFASDITKLSAMALNLVSLLENTFMIKCRGVLPSLSIVLTSANFLISKSTIYRFERTTARWSALPNISPPPAFTSASASIKSFAISKCYSLNATHKGVQSSLSRMLRLISGTLINAFTNPISPVAAAWCKRVFYLESVWLMSNM